MPDPISLAQWVFGERVALSAYLRWGHVIIQADRWSYAGLVRQAVGQRRLGGALVYARKDVGYGLNGQRSTSVVG